MIFNKIKKLYINSFFFFFKWKKSSFLFYNNIKYYYYLIKNQILLYNYQILFTIHIDQKEDASKEREKCFQRDERCWLCGTFQTQGST